MDLARRIWGRGGARKRSVVLARRVRFTVVLNGGCEVGAKLVSPDAAQLSYEPDQQQERTPPPEHKRPVCTLAVPAQAGSQESARRTRHRDRL